MLKKSFVGSPFNNPTCKEQEKFKIEAYLLMRESLNFSRRRSNWEFFNGLLRLGSATSETLVLGVRPDFQAVPQNFH